MYSASPTRVKPKRPSAHPALQERSKGWIVGVRQDNIYPPPSTYVVLYVLYVHTLLMYYMCIPKACLRRSLRGTSYMILQRRNNEAGRWCAYIDRNLDVCTYILLALSGSAPSRESHRRAKGGVCIYLQCMHVYIHTYTTNFEAASELYSTPLWSVLLYVPGFPIYR